MIGFIFEDGATIIAAVPEVIDLVGSVTGPLGYRLVRRWYALLDRGRGHRPRWATAAIPCNTTTCSLHGQVVPPPSYAEPHLFTHEIEAYEDLLARAHITHSLN